MKHWLVLYMLGSYETIIRIPGRDSKDAARRVEILEMGGRSCSFQILAIEED